MRKAALFDIDGTLADLSHRKHYIDNGKKDWSNFLKNVKDDSPIEQTIYLNRLISFRGDMPVILASGRSEDEREDTVNWLAANSVVYEKLYMRAAKDWRADHIIKREILDQIRLDGYDPWIVFDDRQGVVDMWRENGLFVLQCDPHGCDTKHDVYQFHEWQPYPLIIMVGPSGAGKTTIIENFTGDQQRVISSDQLREYFTGNFRDQSQNERVFDAMHKLAETRLKLGLPVILDATHIRNADRIKAAKLVPDHIPVAYAVVDRPLKDKLATAGWRSEVIIKGKTLVEAHDQTFKSNIKAIMNGDGLKNVRVIDLRNE